MEHPIIRAKAKSSLEMQHQSQLQPTNNMSQLIKKLGASPYLDNSKSSVISNTSALFDLSAAKY